jgi:hypothetical protein
MTTKTYRLGSAEMVHAPGLVRWAINGAKFERDRKTVTNVIAATWSIPYEAALALTTGKAAFALDGDTVVFEA